MSITKFNPKVVNNEDEHDGAPFVVPVAWSGGSLEVSMVAEAFSE